MCVTFAGELAFVTASVFTRSDVEVPFPFFTVSFLAFPIRYFVLTADGEFLYDRTGGKEWIERPRS